MKAKQEFEIQYWYGPFVGSEKVMADDAEHATAIMWDNLAEYLMLPIAYQNSKIISVNGSLCHDSAGN